jgi:gluconate 2-dehydrogenase gamma chain
MSFSRREFVHGLAAVWLGAALACRRETDESGPLGGRDEPGRKLASLTRAQARELEAIAARIIPTDETPGAREAGVIWFIDESLTGFAKEQRKPMLQGLKQLARDVRAGHPGQSRFSQLSPAEQDALLTHIQETEFFQSVRFATLAGLLALPKYGGNLDFIGWDLVGQENVHEFTPPFGWYDRPENQQALLGRVL